MPSAPRNDTTAKDVSIGHVGRLTHNFPGAQYVLPADKQEAERLNLQHKLLKAAFGGRNLFVPLNDHPAYFVLDSGTGTAIWLLEVAAQLSSSAILHGIDIEGRLFPQTKPSNISFSISSITDLPAEWSSQFDIVHQRLLMAALTRSQWVTALATIFRVLRPGGWVQLCECEGTKGGYFSNKYGDIIRELYRHRALSIRVFEDLPRMLEAAGFEDVKVERIALPLGKWAGENGVEGRDNLMGVYRGMKGSVLRMGGLGLVHSEQEMDQLLNDVEAEWDTQEGCELGYRIFVARKPSASLSRAAL